MSEPKTNATLRVLTHPGVEVQVYDHQFRLVASATDGWSGEVPTGIYNVRFKAGGQATEQLVHVPPGGATVSGTVDVWRSASPSVEIAGFGSADAIPDREAKQSELAVRRWTNAAEVARREGARSMLFVFAAAPVVHTKEDPARSVQAVAFSPGPERSIGTTRIAIRPRVGRRGCSTIRLPCFGCACQRDATESSRRSRRWMAIVPPSSSSTAVPRATSGGSSVALPPFSPTPSVARPRKWPSITASRIWPFALSNMAAVRSRKMRASASAPIRPSIP